MRIQGHEAKSIRPVGEVILKRTDGDIVLNVIGLLPDFADNQESELPSPTPPRNRKQPFIRDGKGMILDPTTNKPIPNYDEDEPKYKERLRKISQLQTVKMIVDGLEPDQLVFDTKPGADMQEYYESVRSEMIGFGFTVGDFKVLVEIIAEVSGIQSDELDEATADFFDAVT